MKGRAGLVACAVALTAALLSLGAVSSCSAVPGDARVGIDAPSGSEQEFGLVGDYLEHRCGSLDCHGQVGRNLRIWGCEGMRLDPKAVPVCSTLLGGSGTTPAERSNTQARMLTLSSRFSVRISAAHEGGL